MPSLPATLLAAAALLAAGAALAEDRHARAWSMDSDLCAGPGSGGYGLRFDGQVARVAGMGACPGYAHAVDYAFPMEPAPGGGWVFDGEAGQLELDASGGLRRLADLNTVLGEWVHFAPRAGR